MFCFCFLAMSLIAQSWITCVTSRCVGGGGGGGCVQFKIYRFNMVVTMSMLKLYITAENLLMSVCWYTCKNCPCANLHTNHIFD